MLQRHRLDIDIVLNAKVSSFIILKNCGDLPDIDRHKAAYTIRTVSLRVGWVVTE